MKSRRNFLLSCVRTVAFIPFVWAAACNKNDKMSSDKALISEDETLAKALKYAKDGTSSAANMAKTNRETPIDQQVCKTCQLYKAIGDDYGNCIILKGNVTAGGWCSSWAKIVAPNS